MLDHVSISHESTSSPALAKLRRMQVWHECSPFPPPGGIVLWQKSYTPTAAQLAASPGSPLNALVRDVFIEGKPAVASVNTGPAGTQASGREVWESGGWKMEWGRENGLGLIFVVRRAARAALCSAPGWRSGRPSRRQVAYHRLLQLPYIPLLLSSLKDLFLSLYTPAIRTLVDALRSTSAEASSAALQELNRALDGWDKVWEKLLKRVESESGDAPGGVKMRRVSGLREAVQPETPELRTRNGGRRTPGGLSGRGSPAPESPCVLTGRAWCATDRAADRAACPSSQSQCHQHAGQRHDDPS
jgi:hypothetical protein